MVEVFESVARWVSQGIGLDIALFLLASSGLAILVWMGLLLNGEPDA